jgi:hypothetical protein
MLAALLLTTFASSSPAVEELPYQQVADRFLEEHDLLGKTPEEVDLAGVLARDFVSARVGLFEILMPVTSLEEKQTAKDYKDVCAALCEAQSRWLDWLGPQAQDPASTKSDLADLRKWISKWPSKALERASEGAQRDTLELFGASPEVSELSARLGAFMASGAALGLSLEEPKAARLILMPERKGFVEFLAFTGWHNPDLRSIYWAPGIENWSEFRIQDLQVMALQYPAVAPAPGDYSGSTSMKDRDISGLEQQVVQLGMNRLLAYMHGAAIPDSVIRGLSINMLIAQYGSCHTRNDGDLRGRVTRKREIFIRGGRSEGGALPPNIAENRWRTDYGKFHYTKILKQSQKSGASQDKRNKNKFNTFLLVSNDDKDRTVLHAPIMGGAGDKPEVPPDNFSTDYAEFLRAYNVAFMHYLSSAAGGSKKKSAELFSALLIRVARVDETTTFSDLLQELYGVPLSLPDLGDDCLEARFIKWISKQ